jgi:hypothetical protein
MFNAAVETEAIKRRLNFMWLATKYGFFSIVKKDDGFHVRARSRRDLEILREAFLKYLIQNWPSDGFGLEIQDTPNSDYCSRIVLQEVELLFGCVSESIEYPSLRKEIEATPEQSDKLGFYSSIWSTMGAYQTITRHDDEDQAEEGFNEIDAAIEATLEPLAPRSEIDAGFDRLHRENLAAYDKEIEAGHFLRGTIPPASTTEVIEPGGQGSRFTHVFNALETPAPPSIDHGCDRFGHEGELEDASVDPCGYCGAAA